MEAMSTANQIYLQVSWCIKRSKHQQKDINTCMSIFQIITEQIIATSEMSACFRVGLPVTYVIFTKTAPQYWVRYEKHTNSSTSCFSSSLTAEVSFSGAGRWFSVTSLGFCCCFRAGAAVAAAGWGSSFGGGLVSCCSGGRPGDAAPGFFMAASWRALSRWSCCRLRVAGAGFRPRAAAAVTAESENTRGHDYCRKIWQKMIQNQ